MTGSSSAPAIELSGLTKRWGDQVGVDGLDLEVGRGQVVGLIGPNGSGKTTTMRIMLDLIRPTSGSARMLGLDARADGIELRRRVGYLPDDPPLDATWNVCEQLEWYASLRGEPLPDVTGLIERLDLDVDRTVGELSRGNRQKVGIVMAFMHEPDVLVLDEPAAGLDPLVRRELWAMLREVAADGRTVFLSSHVLGDVEEVCDRVAILQHGRLVAEDDVRRFVDRSGRRIHIVFQGRFDPWRFEALDGVRNVSSTEHSVELDIVGSLDPLVKAAALYRVVDMTSSPLTLEEMFLETVGEPYGADPAEEVDR